MFRYDAPPGGTSEDSRHFYGGLFSAIKLLVYCCVLILSLICVLYLLHSLDLFKLRDAATPHTEGLMLRGESESSSEVIVSHTGTSEENFGQTETQRQLRNSSGDSFGSPRDGFATELNHIVLQALVTGYRFRQIVPVVTADNVWTTEALREILGTGKFIQNTILINDNAEIELKNVQKSKTHRYSKTPVLLAAGELLYKVLADKESVEFLYGRMVLVLANSKEIDQVMNDDVSNINARKLNIISVFPSRNFNKLLKEFSVNFSQTGHLTFLRAMMMPTELGEIQYASDSPWFLESMFEVNLNASRLSSITRSQVSYFYMDSNTIKSTKDARCVENKFEFLYTDYISQKKVNITWNADKNHLLVIPHIGDENIEIFYSCKLTNDHSERNIYHCVYDDLNSEFNCNNIVKDQIGRRRNGITKIKIGKINSKMFHKSLSHKNVHKQMKKRSLVDPYAVSEYYPEVRWENFKSILPQLFACHGTFMGCSFCFLFIFYTHLNVNPGVCMGACVVGIGGSCGSLTSLGIQRYLHQTVICSELHRQGLMPVEAYIADAQYGLQMQEHHPHAMEMYRLLAAPVVKLMKISNSFSSFVHRIAEPWRQHMEYVEGLNDSDNDVGRFMILVAVPVLKCIYYLKYVACVLITLVMICLSSVLGRKKLKSVIFK